MGRTILLTGVDGYMGWPTFLKLGRAFPDARIVGVDNYNRRKWVEEVGSVSAIPVPDMNERLATARGLGYTNLEFIEGDLVDIPFVKGLVADVRPDVILHLAAQPSAPYSHINLEKAAYTQDLNMAMTRNLLWALREAGMTGVHFIETTTTGIYGAPSFAIPEGFITMVGADGNSQELPYPNLATSWYHVSKGYNATNMQLMNFQTKMPITDIRTSIVFGALTREMAEHESFASRFDFDFFFGTLFNRWCSMAVIDMPLTIYGTGQQIKPFISLEDACQSLVEAVRLENPGEYRIYNQLTIFSSIKEMAEAIASDAERLLGKKGELTFIPNPRVEVEDTTYSFSNDRFLALLGKKPQEMHEVISESITLLGKYQERILAHKDSFMTKK